MAERNVSEMILDKFKKSIEEDDLFKDILEDLLPLINKSKSNVDKYQELLGKVENEDTRA